MTIKEALEEKGIVTDGFSEDELTDIVVSFIDRRKRPSKKLEAIAETIYREYPYKSGHKKAISSIVSVLRKFPADQIMAATKKFAEARRGCDPRFCPMPTTWYNQQRFLDDPSTWVDRGKKSSDTEKELALLDVAIDTHTCNKDSPNYWAYNRMPEPPESEWEELKKLRMRRNDLRASIARYR